MSRDHYVIGIDCGSTMIKAAIYDEQGKERSVAGSKVLSFSPCPGWMENDAEELWNIVCRVVRELLDQSRIDPASVVCIACTGYGNGLYLIDEKGRPVRNGILSSDVRAKKLTEQWNGDGTARSIRDRTMQEIWAAQPAPLIRWLEEKEPETLSRAWRYFACKDYIRFRMTGEAFFELSDASGSSILNVATGQYDDEILNAWGISKWKDLFPPLRHSTDLCGSVSSECACRTGLKEGTPVAAGLFDIDACSLAVGMIDESQLAMVAGTWGNNLALSRDPSDSEHVFMTSRYCIDPYYLLLEGSPTSANNFEWWVSQFYEKNRSLFMPETASVKTVNFYNECTKLAEQAPLEEDGPIFLPYLYGSPVHADAKGVLFGLDGHQSQSGVLRSVLEGIVFGHRWHVERLLKRRSMSQSIRLTGGAVKSPFWTQIFADLFQTKIEVPEGTEFGTAGAALCAAVAVGLHKNYEEACRHRVRIGRIYEPDPDVASVYEKKYQRFKNLIEIFQEHWSF